MPTHGSLAKAGKMRFVLGYKREWRIVQGERGVVKKFHGKKKKHPMSRNRRNYEKRVLLGQYYAEKEQEA